MNDRWGEYGRVEGRQEIHSVKYVCVANGHVDGFRTTVTSQVRASDLGIAIGKAGCNIEKARTLCRRFFGLEVGEVLLTMETT